MLERKLSRASRRRRSCDLLAALVIGALLALAADPAWAVDPNAQQEQAQVKKEVRRWFVDGLLETYWLMVRDNHPSEDVYNLIYLRGNYDIPKVGRISLRFDFTLRYLVDQAESHLQMGDIRLYYSRLIRFSIASQAFHVRPYFYFTFPSSKVSQQQGNISRPTLIIALHTAVLPGLDIFLTPYIRLNIARYAQTEGGAANTRWLFGSDVGVNYTLPFAALKKRMSVGATIGEYFWEKYGVGGYSQPFNSYFWWEVYAGYSVLQKPVSLDVYFALTTGDTAHENGTTDFQWIDRDKTRLYLSVRGRY